MESENGSGKHVWLPQGDTPGKPKSKVRRQHEASETTAHHKKQLSFSTDDKPRELDMQPPKHSWSVLELKCLVEYIALYWACSRINETWPKFKNHDFWNACAQYVSAHAQCSLRSGVAMRSKVTNYLSKNFSGVKEAEKYFNIDYEKHVHDGNRETNVSETSRATPQTNVELLQIAKESFSKLPLLMKETLLDELLLMLIQEKFVDQQIQSKFPPKFLKKYIQSVENLHKHGKDNLIHFMVISFQTRDGSQETRLPIGKMPFGLLDYMVKFFGQNSTNNLVCEPDYLQWQETMYAKFGVQWVCMYRSPMWEYDDSDFDVSDESQSQSCASVLNPVFTPTVSLSECVSSGHAADSNYEDVNILTQAMAQAGITGTEFNGGESCENITAEESRKPEESYPLASLSPSELWSSNYSRELAMSRCGEGQTKRVLLKNMALDVNHPKHRQSNLHRESETCMFSKS